MRVALMSDTHGLLPPASHFEGADYIIHAGDLAPDYGVVEWYDDVFYPWFCKLPAPFGYTLGNHDFESKLTDDLKNAFIDELIQVGSEQVWFSPWSPTFGDWAWMRDEPDLTEIYNQIPVETTVVVSHTPPYHLCDWVSRGEHVGSKALRVRMHKLPNLHTVVCGHIHEGGRKALLKRDDNRDITVLNVACVDEQYKMIADPITWVDWKD